MSRLKDSYAGCMECGGSMKMKSGGWIAKAIKKPGSFTKQAQSAGMSVSGFRNKVLANKSDYSSTTVKRANLAKTLSKMHKGGDGMEAGPKPTMGPMPYNSKFGRVPVPKPQYTDLYPTGDNGTGTVKITNTPTQSDSAQYKELFNSMLKNDPSSIKEYQYYKKNGIPGGGISEEALFNVLNRMNAYEDAMTHKRKMMMGGSIPGVNGSVIGPSVPTAKTGQSFPRRNAGTSKLAKFKKK